MNWLLSFAKPYLYWAAGIVFALLLAGLGLQTVRLAGAKADYSKLESTYSKEIADQQTARVDAETAARAKETGWTEYAATLNKVKNDEIENSAARAKSIIDSLRNRPARPATGAGGVPETAADGKNGTGAGLYREDGQFLEGEAARGNKLRASLAACYKQYDALR